MLNKRIENFKKLALQEEKIKLIALIIKKALDEGNKILFCGNGGSASDSNHLAGELLVKFKKERRSLPAISLCANNSIMTAIANDYSYDDVFSRQIEGLGTLGDVLVAISTSGKSQNIINAIIKAKERGMNTILLTGENKTGLDVTLELNAPSKITCEIQEMHITIGHIVCELVENVIKDEAENQPVMYEEEFNLI